MSFTTVQFLLKRLTRFFFYSQNIIQIKPSILSMSYYKSSLENVISLQLTIIIILWNSSSMQCFVFPVPLKYIPIMFFYLLSYLQNEPLTPSPGFTLADDGFEGQILPGDRYVDVGHAGDG